MFAGVIVGGGLGFAMVGLNNVSVTPAAVVLDAAFSAGSVVSTTAPRTSARIGIQYRYPARRAPDTDSTTRLDTQPLGIAICCVDGAI
jgi:hypothetical protein